jgi:4-hydroxy-tetrahydrodipicolinate reductase
MRVAVLGCTGRMGIAVARAVAESRDAELSGALTQSGHAMLNVDLGVVAGLPTTGVLITSDLSTALEGADVAIDFTLPAATQSNLTACRKHKVALVMGTTGLNEAQRAVLAQAAQEIPIVYARNMSVGVNVTTELARLAARYLGGDWDTEITEAHHRYKVDAPSGTALQLGEAIARERGVDLTDVAVYGRAGKSDGRSRGEIGFSSIRAGNIVGDHSVLFASDTEIVELQHHAADRSVFAQGALRAARWLTGRDAGLYGMPDVLEFNT